MAAQRQSRRMPELQRATRARCVGARGRVLFVPQPESARLLPARRAFQILAAFRTFALFLRSTPHVFVSNRVGGYFLFAECCACVFYRQLCFFFYLFIYVRTWFSFVLYCIRIFMDLWVVFSLLSMNIFRFRELLIW